MTYTVTYRKPDGIQTQEVFDAESRSALFVILKEKKISPIRIAEGSVKAANTSNIKITKPILISGAFIGIALVVAFLILSPSDAPSNKITVKKNAKPDVTTKLPVVARTPVEEPKKPETKEIKTGPGYHEGRRIISAVTNATGYTTIVTVGDDGRRKRHVVARPPIFERATDEVIMIALTTPENQEIPPLPDLGGKRADDEFRESLKTPIKILPTDSDKVRGYKEAVKAARKEILQRLDEGEHFADIIQDHCKLKNENGAIRIEAIAELRQIEKKHGKAEAIKYRDQMNDAFSRMGISPIELSEQSIDNQQE